MKTFNWKVKMSEHFKETHSKELGRENALNLAVGINITSPNYSFMFVNCFKLLFCSKLMKWASYLCQQSIFSRNWQHYQIFRQFFFVFCFFWQFLIGFLQFYISHCNSVNNVEICIIICHRLEACTNTYLYIDW